MKNAIQFFDNLIDQQQAAWEKAVKELDGDEEAWFYNGSDTPLEQVLCRPEVFLARTPPRRCS